ncbi:unnamed protein product [Caenorhabditis bovis]|uniref:Neurotransmitter-gated ion-channel ligand-binding domain-containing protein n=1 Tax=Caenorhabditis bovis TaxID=2654633 RepID=A0A8S1F7H6_9PELO|nr:unnamed protein product [Caenorhabditis bovis]
MWIALVNYIEVISIVCSLPVNAFLMYCIFTKSPKQFGSYIYLMAWFCGHSMFFSILAGVTHKHFHTYRSSFMMFTADKILDLPSWGVVVLLTMCCISFGFTLFILALQFIYRYFAMSKIENLIFFQGTYRFYWVGLGFILVMVYSIFALVSSQAPAAKDFELRNELATAYHTAIENVNYVAGEYYLVLSATIVYCGYYTYRGMSEKTVQLSNHMVIQKQLFRALLVQTMVPTILIFIPVVFFYLFPIFQIPIGEKANILSITLVIYPIVEPFGTLLTIKNYRKTVKQISGTTKLIDEIFDIRYDPNMKPSDELTNVEVVPNTFLLISMDQQQETIEFMQEFLLVWKDPLLHWNPTNASFHKDWVKVPIRRVWTPGVVFTNAIKTEQIIENDKLMADLNYQGVIRASFPGVVNVPCPLRIENFPYDKQECEIAIGPWNFGNNSVVVSSKFQHISPEKERFEKTEFSEITYTVHLKRKPVYYVLVIQAPTFILCTLTIFGVFTPFSSELERKGKVPLCLNMFAAISLMLNLVSEMMPKASRLPLLGNYIIAEVFVVTAATLASIAIHATHQYVHTTAIKPPKWLRYLILFEMCKRRKIRDDQPTGRQINAPQLMLTNESSSFESLKESIQQACSSNMFSVRKKTT